MAPNWKVMQLSRADQKARIEVLMSDLTLCAQLYTSRNICRPAELWISEKGYCFADHQKPGQYC